ncbi:hypothetical protein GRF59_00980 [Paenibacillus sp. HJL G12]|uniref:DNA-binding protein n=1 Tax=Paenibacillus dendrobii TaxID=2691084 RepID=A0A7X3IE22_9BACL|nr:hypothetical protein [Paenibacillus dendrobii]MWV42192.1 hypothetical protein [Paenibacillus dendrobii]
MNDRLTALSQIKIDTLVNMIKMAYAFENWEEVISLSESLLEIANLTKYSERQMQCSDSMEKPVVYYFGYSYLMKGLALQKLRAYTESIDCVIRYSDLSWVEDTNQENKYYTDSFKVFAKANLLTLEILLGNKDKLPDYIEVLHENEDEILPGLITVVESALVHDFNADLQITQLVPYISNYHHYNRPVRIAYYLTVHYLLALYHYKNKKYSDAINFTLHNLTISDRLGNDKYFKKSVALFELLKTHATVPQITEYSSILNSILKGEIENEESFDLNSIIGSAE